MKKVPRKSDETETRFIQRALVTTDEKLPWTDANDRIIKSFNLRLPESLHLKLQFIAQKTPNSIHGFVLAAVEEAVNLEIAKLI